MRPQLRLYLAIGFGSFFVLLLGLKFVATPYINKRAKSELSVWLKQIPAETKFKDVKVLWNGVRITNLRVVKGANSLKTNVELTLGLDSSFPFVKPNLVTLKKPSIRLVRNPLEAQSKLENRLSTKGSTRTLQEYLDRYFSAGISLRVDNAEIRVAGAGNETLLEIPAFNADLNASDRTAQITTGAVNFKDGRILSEVTGQILLQKQREYYPFLLHARDPGGEPWQLKGQVSHDFDSVDIRHKRKGVPSAWAEQGRHIGNPEDVLFIMRAKVDGLITRDHLSFQVRLASSNLFIQHESLGKTPLGPWPITVTSRGLFLPETGAFEISEGSTTLSGRSKEESLILAFSGRKNRIEAPLREDPFRLRFHASKQSCQAIVDTMPENVLPLLSGLKLDGEFSIDGEINLLTQEDILKFTPGMNKMNCRVLKSPVMLTREWLFAPARELPEDLKHNLPLLMVKMGRPVSRYEIPDDFFKAVVSAEDAKFWRHDGILIESLLAALHRNMEVGHVKFGGSTITMQLAKNLYLDRDKVISRKLQEIALAWVLEQNLSKAEILELYANAVEFAPNTYGISKASRLYFDKFPRELTTAEALFLASILPNPAKNFSESFCNARLTRTLKNRMGMVATGLAALSQERDFMSIYAADLGRFSFALDLSGCDTYDRSRISQIKKTKKPL